MFAAPPPGAGATRLRRQPLALWTDAEIEALIGLCAAGFNASEIGERLGTTRNAILGKLHRLRHGNTWPGKRIRPRYAKAQPPVSLRPLSFIELDARTCHWPLGKRHEPPRWFCGAPVEIFGKPYCQHHRKLAGGPWQRTGRPFRLITGTRP